MESLNVLAPPFVTKSPSEFLQGCPLGSQKTIFRTNTGTVESQLNKLLYNDFELHHVEITSLTENKALCLDRASCSI